MNKKYRDIAIVGMAGKFPGANTVSQFWDNICEGKESIYHFSNDELKREGIAEKDLNDPLYVKASPTLDGFDCFDPSFFKIPPMEAELMDPQMRLLLQCAWETLEDGGYASSEPQNVGVFTGAGGVTTNYYSHFVNQSKRFEKITASPTHLGNDKDFLSTYISYRLNLTGPSITVQTACSTSLVALHQACLSLFNDECDMAIAGGVNVRVPHIEGYHYKEGYIFSKSGHVKTFDAQADGVVFGSGLGLVLIKPLEYAIRDNDNIYAVIKGSAISNDGKAKMSYAASSAKGQIRCITDALSASKISASSIGFVESHGTGTAMGDPEEVKALSAAFKSQTDNKQYCVLGAVKTNVGHLDAAAGITGLIKAAMVLKHGVIPPTVHFTNPNPKIKFERTPFYVNNTLEQWKEQELPRRAAVNCLGVGGTNAFFVLEEFSEITDTLKTTDASEVNDSLMTNVENVENVESVKSVKKDVKVIVPLSAKSTKSLFESLKNHLAFLENEKSNKKCNIDLTDLSYTFQVGRDQMPCRIAFVVSSIDELLSLMTHAVSFESLNKLSGTENAPLVFPKPEENSEILAEIIAYDEIDVIKQDWLKNESIDQLALAWVKGVDLNWRSLSRTNAPKRISLPTYAFNKQRFWIEPELSEVESSELEVKESGDQFSHSSIHYNHPLIQKNTSDFEQVSFTTEFSRNNTLLNHVGLNSNKGKWHNASTYACYIEMLRESFRQLVGHSKRFSNSQFIVNDLQFGAALYNDVFSDNSKSNPKLITSYTAHPTSNNQFDVDIWLGDLSIEQLSSENLSIENIPKENLKQSSSSSLQTDQVPVFCQARIQAFDNNHVSDVSSEGDLLKSRFKQKTPRKLHAIVSQIKSEENRVVIDGQKAINAILDNDLNSVGYNKESTTSSNLSSLLFSKTEIVSEIPTVSKVNHTHRAADIYIGAFESVIQSIQIFLSRQKSISSLPVSIESLIFVAPVQEPFHVITKERNDQSNVFDVELIDTNGQVMVDIVGFAFSEQDVRQNALQNCEQVKEEASLQFHQEEWRTFDFSAPDSAKNRADDRSESTPQRILFVSDTQSEQLIDIKRHDSIIVDYSNHYSQLAPNHFQCGESAETGLDELFSTLVKSTNRKMDIVYGWGFGKGKESIYKLFNFFLALRDHAIYIGRVTLLGHYDELNEETCWEYSWIGFERSLRKYFPETVMNIIYFDGLEQQSFNRLIDGCDDDIIWFKGKSCLKLQSQNVTEDFNQLSSHRVEGESNLSLPGACKFESNGLYLITGGVGSLGMQLSLFLAKSYQARLILVGRKKKDKRIIKQLERLKQEGAAEVNYVALDIADEKAVLEWQGDHQHSLNGIIHAAGVESIGSFSEKDRKDIDLVLAPKTKGAEVIDNILAPNTSDFICYFSSSAAILGDFGACDYAISNRYLMAHALNRNLKSNEESKLKRFVINWPLFESSQLILDSNDNDPASNSTSGMGVGDNQQTEFYLKTSGQKSLDIASGINVLQTILASSFDQVLVLFGQVDRINRMVDRVYNRRLTVESNAINSSTFINKTMTMAKSTLDELTPVNTQALKSDLQQLISTFLKLPIDSVEEDINLADFGFDSINLADFATVLSKHFELSITPALFFTASTVTLLSDYLCENHKNEMQILYSVRTETEQEKIVSESTKASSKENGFSPADLVRRTGIKPELNFSRRQSRVERSKTVAVVGMSGRFPKASNVEEMWEMLVDAQHGITEVPTSRWNWRDYFSETSPSQNTIATNRGGFIYGVDEFDPLFFEMSPKEAEEMEPSERLILIEAYKAIEDARCSPESLKGKDVGVFVGMEESYYDQFFAHQGITTNGNAMVSSRLSYFLDFRGPTISTNTACSSGLVAFHQAVQSIQLGECEKAIVAAVSLSLSVSSYEMMSDAGMLSPDGLCRSFSKDASGIGAGEAVVVLMLESLESAQDSSHKIYGTVKASGINFDGKTNGVTAPSGQSQAKLIEKIYKNNHIDVSKLSHIVTHGTGTKLGDPVEINALNSAYRVLRSKDKSEGASTNNELPYQKHCALTSCKSNFGHTMAASGLVSVVSLLKGMENKTIPASLHCDDLNEYIDWDNSPFYVNQSSVNWPHSDGVPYLAAVSSFGRSGTNAHVVFESFVAEKSRALIGPPAIHSNIDKSVFIPLSAKSAEQLSAKVKELRTFILEQSYIVNQLNGAVDNETTKEKVVLETAKLHSLAYSLQVTRDHMDERVAFVVDSFAKLIELLELFEGGTKSSGAIFSGSVSENRKAISVINHDDDMQAAVLRWIERKKFSKLAEMWVKGLDFDWQLIYSQCKTSVNSEDWVVLEKLDLPKYPFAKERYWIKSERPSFHRPALVDVNKEVRRSITLHPLVHKNSSDFERQSYTSTFTGDEFFLNDHRVSTGGNLSQRFLPGVAYLEMAKEAVIQSLFHDEDIEAIKINHQVNILDVVWLTPFIVHEKNDLHIDLLLIESNDNVMSSVAFEIYSHVIISNEIEEGDLRNNDLGSDRSHREVIHCQGRVTVEASSRQHDVQDKEDINSIKTEVNGQLFEHDALYSKFREMGLHYGSGHKGIKQLFVSDQSVFAEIQLPSVIDSSIGEFDLHPSILDSALQSTLGLITDLKDVSNQPPLPFALESLRLISKCTAKMFVLIKHSNGYQHSQNVSKLDIDLFDQAGNLCIELKGFTSRLLTDKSFIEATDSLKAESNSLAKSKVDLSSELVVSTPVWQPITIKSHSQSTPLLNEHLVHDDVINYDSINHTILLIDNCGYAVDKIKGDLPQLAKASIYSIEHQFEQPFAKEFVRVAQEVFSHVKTSLANKTNKQDVFQIIINVPSIDALHTYLSLSGLLKSAQLENPRFKWQLVAVNTELTLEKMANELVHLCHAPLDSVIRMNKGVGESLVYQPCSHLPTVDLELARTHNPFKENGVYLITGGLGGLAKIFTQEILSETSQSTIVLTGRREISDSEWRNHLEIFSHKFSSTSLTDRLVYRAINLNDPQNVTHVIDDVVQQYACIHGVFHCAGMVADNYILKKSHEEFISVLEPKVMGVIHLNDALKNIPLDFMALFSSTAAITGNLGQSDYAIANGFMDQFASIRNKSVMSKQGHGHTLSINWPLWRDGGMTIDKASEQRLLNDLGMSPMSKDSGLWAFYQCIVGQLEQTVVIEGHVQRIESLLRNEKTPNLNSMVSVQKVEAAVANLTTQEPGQSLLNHKTEASASQSLKAVEHSSFDKQTQTLLCEVFSEIIKLPANKIEVNAPLEKYGIDSILAMSLTNALENIFGQLSKTLFFEYQTVAELAEYFVESHSDLLEKRFTNASTQSTVSDFSSSGKHSLQDSSQNSSQDSNSSKPTNHNGDKIETFISHSVSHSRKRYSHYFAKFEQDGSILNGVQSKRHSTAQNQPPTFNQSIAIIGLSGQYPESESIDAYWENLRDGVDCIVEVPEERWDWKSLYSEDKTKEGFHFSKWGGFIRGVDEFDPRFFNISPKEAKNIDPQERLFLQHAWKAVEDAGYTRESLQVSHDYDQSGQVGVYAGVMYGEYNLSGSLASIANRVSYVMNLHGPSLTLDTMCSSSLTAIHIACQDLKVGRTDLAIAGGVNISIDPNKYLILSEGQFISSDGHCQSFGEGGDGYIPGEGVGVVILKRLVAAKSDGDHIYGVIKGSALNHGGKTNGYTVPNPRSQTGAIVRALKEANVNPMHVSYIEAHGTGTKLGDPIEISALSKAFGHELFNDKNKTNLGNPFSTCMIGSAKSNIGHCESAAGIAGLTKVLLQMKHNKIVPSLHSTRLNPNINFNDTPFVVNQSLKDWERPVIDDVTLPRIAGISSFGAGGANAHLIIEQYDEPNNLTSNSQQNSDESANIAVPLSARTKTQLYQKVVDFASFLEKAPSQMNLVSLAYTLQAGREAMEERICLLVKDKNSLMNHLTNLIESSSNNEIGAVKNSQECFVNSVKKNKETIQLFNTDEDFQATLSKWFENKKLSHIAELWTKGLEIHWNNLYGADKPHRMSLPAYPFAREKYWHDITTTVSKLLKGDDRYRDPHASANLPRSGTLHPLVHENISSITEQQYVTHLSGSEEYLVLHRDGQKKWLSGLSQLEIAKTSLLMSLKPKTIKSMGFYDVVFGENIDQLSQCVLTTVLLPKDRHSIDFELYQSIDDKSVLEEKIFAQGHFRIDATDVSSMDALVVNESTLHDVELPNSSVTSFLFLQLKTNSSHTEWTAKVQTSAAISHLVKDNDSSLIMFDQLINSVATVQSFESKRKNNILHGNLSHDDSLTTLTHSIESLRYLEPYSYFEHYSKENDHEGSLEKPTNNEYVIRIICDPDFKNIDLDISDFSGRILVQIRGLVTRTLASIQTDKASVAYLKSPESQSVVEDNHSPIKRKIPLLHNDGLNSNANLTSSSSFAKKVESDNVLLVKPKHLPLVSTKDSIFQPIAHSLAEEKPLASVKLASVNRSRNIIGIQGDDEDSRVAIRDKELVSLYRLNNNVYEVYIHSENGEISREQVFQLKSAFTQLSLKGDVKTIILKGGDNHFAHGGRDIINAGIESGLFEQISQCSAPTLAVLKGSTTGFGFLLASLADFLILNETQHYGFETIDNHLFTTLQEYQFFAKRFGESKFKSLTIRSTPLLGSELKTHNWPLIIQPLSKIDQAEHSLLDRLADKSVESLGLLKLHLAGSIITLVSDLSTIVDSDIFEGVSNIESSFVQVIIENVIKKATQANGKLGFFSLHLSAENNLIVTLNSAENNQFDQGAISVVNELTLILQAINESINEEPNHGIRSLIISSDSVDFIPTNVRNNKYTSNVERLKLHKCLLDLPILTIAVTSNGAIGHGWLTALCFDYCIYTSHSIYSSFFGDQSVDLAEAAIVMFKREFDYSLAQSLLYAPVSLKGEELKNHQSHCICVEKENALKEAESLAKQSLQTPFLNEHYWKGHRYTLFELATLNLHNNLQSTELLEGGMFEGAMAQSMTEHETEYLTFGTSSHESVHTKQEEKNRVMLKSNVVTADIYAEGICVIRLHDKTAKNMFSDDLVEGMEEAFDFVARSKECKVVILTGYDNYFASGGTKETLLSIQEGKAQFTERKVYQLPMNCPVPVISAMQGHGLGAGWSMGMFADFVIFSEESHFVSPYMNYGFTPGAGSTFMFPEKLGLDFARDSLITAFEFEGIDLKRRGLTFPVVPRKSVLSEAFRVAHRLAKQSTDHLKAIKQLITCSFHDKLETTYQQELAMHDKTFVGREDTLKQIQSKFLNQGQKQDQTQDQKQVASQEQGEPKSQTSNLMVLENQGDFNQSLMQHLKQLLAEELHMDVEELDEDEQFIELGLDSITGVTWVRKINEQYKLAIEATKVYSHPTLLEFSDFVFTLLPEADGTKAHYESSNAHYIKGETNRAAAKGSVDIISAETKSTPLTQQNILVSINQTLKELLAQELYLDVDDIDEDTQFIDLGLDSITGVTWIRKINETYALTIEATNVYRFPTLAEMSQYVADEAQLKGTIVEQNVVELSEVESAKTIEPADKIKLIKNAEPTEYSQVLKEPTTYESKVTNVLPFKQSALSNLSGMSFEEGHVRLRSWRKDQPNIRIGGYNNSANSAIAVIGVAGQFPSAKNIDEYWINLATAKSCITEVPPSRWNMDEFYQSGDPVPGKTNSRWMGAMETVDQFDPLFFSLSPIEAENMDPQQRLFLQACWHSIENAGYDPTELSNALCGVFVGCSNGDYHQISREHQLSAQGFTGSSPSILAARISYFLNLQGPSLAIDTACSSSLVAIANACDSLNSFSSNLALAGGVYVMSTPEMHIKSSQSGMLSPDGRCFTFDHRANGFVPGEAVGVVLLKRLEDAQKDNDLIQGVINGWGVNQDGKTNGITAPNPESQSRLQRSVYDRFDIDPKSIQLIEAHGTGTKLGDPIEVDALKDTFKHYTDQKRYCALGSVKSNIGHCLTAAGITGFIKLILSIKHRQLPPTIHYEKTNEHLQLEQSPFYINDTLKDWHVDHGQVRQAAISSFGFSGTNAHLVVAEYSDQNKELSPAKPAITSGYHSDEMLSMVPFSARSQEQLLELVEQSLSFIKNTPNIDFNRMVYTLQVGRAAMEHRIGFLVSSCDELAKKLEGYINYRKNQSLMDALEKGTVVGEFSGTSRKALQTELKRTEFELGVSFLDSERKTQLTEHLIAAGQLSQLMTLWVKGFVIDWTRLYRGVKPKRMTLPLYPFAQEKYWLQSKTSSTTSLVINAEDKREVGGTFSKTSSKTLSETYDVIHPLLHKNVSTLRQQCYTTRLLGNEFFLTDHQLHGQKVLPGVAYLEMAHAAIVNAIPELSLNMNVNVSEYVTESEAAQVVELQNVTWLNPCVVAQPRTLSTNLLAQSDSSFEFQILDADDQTPLCRGDIIIRKAFNDELDNNGQINSYYDLGELEQRMTGTPISPQGIYEVFANKGLNYGSSHQGIQQIQCGNSELLTTLKLPSHLEAGKDRFHLHPSLMDSALQASLALVQNFESVEHVDNLEPLDIEKTVDQSRHNSGSPSVPFAVDAITIYSNSSSEMSAWIRFSDGFNDSSKIQKFDVDLMDLTGKLCARIVGFTTRALESNEQVLSTSPIVEEQVHNKSKSVPKDFDDEFYQSLIESILSDEMSIDEAVELG